MLADASDMFARPTDVLDRDRANVEDGGRTELYECRLQRLSPEVLCRDLVCSRDHPIQPFRRSASSDRWSRRPQRLRPIGRPSNRRLSRQRAIRPERSSHPCRWLPRSSRPGIDHPADGRSRPRFPKAPNASELRSWLLPIKRAE